jgi:hypothetical protein
MKKAQNKEIQNSVKNLSLKEVRTMMKKKTKTQIDFEEVDNDSKIMIDD